MPIKINTSGLDKLIENAEKLHGTHQVSLADVLTDDFVSRHSKYSGFDELLADIGVTTKEEFTACPTKNSMHSLLQTQSLKAGWICRSGAWLNMPRPSCCKV